MTVDRESGWQGMVLDSNTAPTYTLTDDLIFLSNHKSIPKCLINL